MRRDARTLRVAPDQARQPPTAFLPSKHQGFLLYASYMVPVAATQDPDLDVASARFFRVLGDPTRLAVLELLLDRPRTVSQLVDALGVSQSKVSNHLACLRWCRFVETERAGREVTYRVADRRVRRVLEHGRQLADEHCAHLVSCRRIGPDWA